MTPTKQWQRWTQQTKQFPKSKYRFTQLLKRVGDYVETYPMTKKECQNMQQAARFWAYIHKKRVNSPIFPAGDNKYYIRVTLVSQHRLREVDYDELQNRIERSEEK